MRNRFHETHPTTDELLRALDGELDSRVRAELLRHVEDCWSCRHKQEELRQTIETYSAMVEWEREQPMAAPPHGWCRFAARLRAVAAAAVPRRRNYAAYVGLLAAGVLLAASVALVSPSRVVSAKEALARTSAAERVAESGGMNRVVVQRIRIETPKRNLVASVWRSGSLQVRWQPQEGSDLALWTEVESFYRAHSFDFNRPVSVANQAAWLKAASRYQESVNRDGEFLHIQMRNDAESDIVEAELVVRESDWHPVEQRWTVRAQAETRRYRVVETGFEVTPMTAELARWMNGPEVPPSSSPALVSKSADPSAVETNTVADEELPNLDDAEVASLAAVFHSRVEAAEVRRDTKSVAVTTYADDPSKIRVLEQALADVPHVRVTFAKSADDSPLTGGSAIAAMAPEAPLFFNALVSNVGQAHAANILVNKNSAALRQLRLATAAIADLLRRFPAARRQQLSVEAAAELNRLGEAHLAAARSAWSDVRSASVPLLASAGVSAPGPIGAPTVCDWTHGGPGLADAVALLEDLYARAFTALAGGSEGVRTATPSGLQKQLLEVQGTVAGAFDGGCRQ